VQIPGAAAKTSRGAFDRAMKSMPSFRGLMFAYVQAFLEQVLVSVACNGRHSLKEKLARWLLMMRDRSDDDVMPIGQSLNLHYRQRRPADHAGFRCRHAWVRCRGVCLRCGLRSAGDRIGVCQIGRIYNGRSVWLAPEDARSSDGDFPAGRHIDDGIAYRSAALDDDPPHIFAMWGFGAARQAKQYSRSGLLVRADHFSYYENCPAINPKRWIDWTCFGSIDTAWADRKKAV
jgi:hypothetical protein